MLLLAFMARVSLFLSMTAIGVLVGRTETMITDRAMRLSISAIQIICVATLYILGHLVAQIFRVLHHTNTGRFTQLNVLRSSRTQDYEKSIESVSVPATSRAISA
jgi:hypothetical protein